MEQNPILTSEQTQKKAMLTKPQLWLLAGSILIGIAMQLWLELDHHALYSVFWLVTLAVFVIFNFKRVLENKTVLALIVPTAAFCVILLFDYMNPMLLGFTSLAIPALLLTIGVFTTQGIAYKREGKAVLGVLRAVFVKPFTAIDAYFRAYAGVFGGKKGEHAKHGWIGLAVGLPLLVVVLALLSGADAGMQKLLGTWIDNISLWEWFWRVVVVFVSAMLFYSLFYNLTWGKQDADLLPVRQSWKLAGPGVVMMLLLAAYALFTYVQFTYLFGKTLPVDLTYSEYARDGFGQFLAVTLVEPGQQFVQVGGGEFPIEWSRGTVVAGLEVVQAVHDGVEVGEVVGRERFSLNDREVDLDLIEPGRMHRGVHHDRIGELGGEPVDSGLATVGGTVIDNPEHPLGRGVRFGGHHLGDEAGKRVDTGGVLTAAEDIRPVHVVGGQVGLSAATVVVVVDPHHPRHPGRERGMAAAAGLDGGGAIRAAAGGRVCPGVCLGRHG